MESAHVAGDRLSPQNEAANLAHGNGNEVRGGIGRSQRSRLVRRFTCVGVSDRSRQDNFGFTLRPLPTEQCMKCCFGSIDITGVECNEIASNSGRLVLSQVRRPDICLKSGRSNRIPAPAGLARSPL